MVRIFPVNKENSTLEYVLGIFLRNKYYNLIMLEIEDISKSNGLEAKFARITKKI